MGTATSYRRFQYSTKQTKSSFFRKTNVIVPDSFGGTMQTLNETSFWSQITTYLKRLTDSEILKAAAGIADSLELINEKVADLARQLAEAQSQLIEVERLSTLLGELEKQIDMKERELELLSVPLVTKMDSIDEGGRISLNHLQETLMRVSLGSLDLTLLSNENYVRLEQELNEIASKLDTYNLSSFEEHGFSLTDSVDFSGFKLGDPKCYVVSRTFTKADVVETLQQLYQVEFDLDAVYLEGNSLKCVSPERSDGDRTELLINLGSGVIEWQNTGPFIDDTIEIRGTASLDVLPEDVFIFSSSFATDRREVIVETEEVRALVNAYNSTTKLLVKVRKEEGALKTVLMPSDIYEILNVSSKEEEMQEGVLVENQEEDEKLRNSEEDFDLNAPIVLAPGLTLKVSFPQSYCTLDLEIIKSEDEESDELALALRVTKYTSSYSLKSEISLGGVILNFKSWLALLYKLGGSSFIRKAAIDKLVQEVGASDSTEVADFIESLLESGEDFFAENFTQRELQTIEGFLNSDASLNADNVLVGLFLLLIDPSQLGLATLLASPVSELNTITANQAVVQAIGDLLAENYDTRSI